MAEVNTILFSDVHLGTPVSRAWELLNTLKEYRFKKLIIVGDMFDSLNFKYLTSTHWELLEHIGKVSRRGVEVVWIEGNHDARFVTFMAHMIGIPVRWEYSWEVNHRKFLALHGNQFDSFIIKNAILGKFLANAYAFLQYLLSSHFFEFFLNIIADQWLRLTEQVATGAIDYAHKKHHDVVICGHTHFVYNTTKDSIEYYNLGSWTTKPSFLLVIDDAGKAEYREVR